MIQKAEALFVMTLVKFSKINGKYLFIILGLLTLLPLLLLSVFNNPGSDDFDYEFKRPLQEIIQTQIDLYYGWSGRYFSVGFMTINPDFFINFSFYKFYPIIIICLFIIVLYWFLKLIFSEEKVFPIVSDLGFFLFLFCLQIPDMCQAFFWYSSSICYQFGIVLFLIFSISFLKYKKSKSKSYLFLAILCLIASIGSNEILMLIILFLSIWYVVIKFVVFKKIDFHERLLLLIIVVFSFIVIVAPGNNVRLLREGVKINSYNLLLSILKTAFYLVKYFIKWLPLILLTAYLYSGRLNEILNKIKDKRVFIHPFLCLILIFTILFPCFFIGFWTKNYLLPDRAINSIYFFFLLFVIYFVFCLLNFFKSNFNQDLHSNNKYIFTIILVLFTFSETPISEAYYDLISGKAYKYDKELEDRFLIINSSNKSCIEVPMLINCPKTIYNSEVMGLTSDKNNWKNIEISKYYKKTVIVTPSNLIISE
ncbi:DUF6056 family protein [Flavobacterium sp. AED]|uniref:DUF6056 family protein n=1 Tax=Flavobacterium sp. AED TaxID=1423323 RepID=UPI0005807EDC|nr:hypothetical protein OA85_11810 [Flavobacterium sp. AED]